MLGSVGVAWSPPKEVTVEIKVPIIEGKYSVQFPKKCVYCGKPATKTLRETASAGSRRRRTAIFDVPYCDEHARATRRNATLLNAAFVVALVLSCAILFAVTSSLLEEPGTGLWVFLALVAVGLAIGARWLLRRMVSKKSQAMADMLGGDRLGVRIQLAGQELTFAFANDEIAEEFARLNAHAQPQ
jgi:hypothetical protein